MTLSLLANPDLRPCLERLLPLCSHKTILTYLSRDLSTARRQIRVALENDCQADGITLLDGFDLLPEAPWENGNAPFVVPRVHDVAALLLGAAHYRALFQRYEGGICWMLPGASLPFFSTHPGNCQVLCHLVDLQLSLPDTEVHARVTAQQQNWDYIQIPSDCSLLESLLGGGRDAQDSFLFSPFEELSQSALNWK